jgi:hypothetical protein
VNEIREAASFEGLIVLAIIFFVLSRIQRAGSRTGQKGRDGSARPVAPTAPTPTQQEGTALESILREIERVKQQGARHSPGPVRRPPPGVLPGSPPVGRAPPPKPAVVQDERGPLGRPSSTPLSSAEDVEERTSLEQLRSRGEPQSLEMTTADWQRRQRAVVNADAEAEAIVERRIREAEARNRPHAEVDHQAFDQRIRVGNAAPGAVPPSMADRLRQAIIWREILGPPKAFDE